VKLLHITFALIFLALVSGCMMDPHENFLDGLNYHIGRKIENALPGWMGSESLLQIVELQNGNLEYEYAYYGTCRYFFEIDPHTQIILGARFEGASDDCIVNP
jgi:hypothetical protein